MRTAPPAPDRTLAFPGRRGAQAVPATWLAATSLRVGYPAGRLLLVALILASAACTTPARERGVRSPMAELSAGKTGWFRVQSTLGLDPRGELLVPPATPLEQQHNAPAAERLTRAYREQFSPLALGPQANCEALTGSREAAAGPVYLLVHGVGGDGDEWARVLPTLQRQQPAGMFMFRWFFAKERRDIVDGLVDGIVQLAGCFPKNRVVVLAHSAGGVLCAFAASRLTLEADPPRRLEILTVASPLAGTGMRDEVVSAEGADRFFFDLGAAISGYPAAAPGVVVLHLRTQYPADTEMKPGSDGHLPNAPAAIVKGARTIDLPDTVDHLTSLLYVAQELAAGRLP